MCVMSIAFFYELTKTCQLLFITFFAKKMKGISNTVVKKIRIIHFIG